MSTPPQTLGQYQIIREIARSNDIVYEAYDPLMNRRVAVKELSMPGGSTPQQLEDRVNRFRREAQAVGSLNHAHIMTVYSFSQDGDRYFMAMEYLDGITLRKEIDNRGFLEMDRAIEIASEVLDGLAHAHDSGVVHRDIKPDNVQIVTTGQVKITDFGIARLTFQPNLTMDGQVFGTPSYMSPEQVVGKEIDNRTDLFSVGVMLYEMMVGTKPFTGDNVIAITHSIINSQLGRPQQIPNDIWNVITKSLEKAPQLRYTNAREMRAALLEAQERVNTPANTYDQYSQAPSMLTGAAPYAQPQYGTYQPQSQQYGQPQMSPYGGAIPTPYGNPYGASQLTPPPVINPAGGYTQQPYGQNTYGAYNPYQQPTPGQFQPPAPYQVYYPPAPGPPVFSAKTREMARQFVWATLIFAVIVAIVLVAFMAITNSIRGSSAAKAPVSTSVPVASNTGSAATGETTIPKASEASETPTAPRQMSAKMAPENPIDRTEEANEFLREAERAETSIAKSKAYISAGKVFKEMNHPDDAMRAFNLAFEVRRAAGGTNREMRDILYEMQELYPIGHPTRNQVEILLKEYGG